MYISTSIHNLMSTSIYMGRENIYIYENIGDKMIFYIKFQKNYICSNKNQFTRIY